ncbi:hypothetical protein BC941DRAFT_438177 [Chlamydoabsidia padenii]|nr:hypothetical protein BC941DRAFT_438177 [Chlamydoabsidia padenii]
MYLPPHRPFNVPPLPPGWIEYFTPGGHPYWFNTYNENRTWERPVVAAGPTEQQTTKSKLKRVRIPGTTWLLVTMDDGTDFYYDKTTKTSVWEMPKELEEPITQFKEDQQEAKRKRQDSAEENVLQASKRQKEDEQPGETTEMTEEDIMWQMENMDPDELAALGYIPEEEEEQDTSDQPPQPEDKQPPETKNNQLTEEEKVEQFTQMLSEKDLSPFSSWEKELPKLIVDPRYNLVEPHNKRKSLFNNYCRVLASEKKKTKKKAPEEDYRDLLQDMVVNKMYWDDFRRKAKNDPRFKAVRESKVRETLFKDYIKHLANKRPSSSKTVEDRYRQLLAEQKVHVGMRWRDAKRLLEHDDRYHDIESKTLREDLFRDYLDELEH